MTARCRNAVVMGVCGVGKSTVAGRLAEAYGGRFVEGDAFHSPQSVHAMSLGIPLTDAARWGWLERICQAVEAVNTSDGAPAFIACSALKRSYRAFLRERIGPLAVVYLDGDPQLIRRRMAARKDHFMPPALLESQLRDLEPPDIHLESAVCRLDIAATVEDVMREAVLFCRRHVASAGRSRDGKHTLSAGNVHHEGQRPKSGGEAQ